MLFLFYGALDSGTGESVPETPATPEAPVAIVALMDAGGASDDELVVRYDLADDRDMQDLIMIFEAFRSVMNG